MLASAKLNAQHAVEVVWRRACKEERPGQASDTAVETPEQFVASDVAAERMILPAPDRGLVAPAAAREGGTGPCARSAIHATTFWVFILASVPVAHCHNTTVECDHRACATVISDSLSLGSYESAAVNGGRRVLLFPQFISSGQHLQSRNGQWVLHLQDPDGHLVLYPASCKGSSCPPIAGHRWANWRLNYALPSKLKLEDNGDLVVIDANGMVVWSTGTNVGSQLIDAWFIVQNDGDLVLYQQKKDEPNARAAWRSNTRTGSSEQLDNNGFCKCMRQKFSTRDLMGQFGLTAKPSWEGQGPMSDFMRKHAIWPQSNTLSFDVTTTITVNTTGKYEVQGLCDDSATFYIDGELVLTVPRISTFPNAEIDLTFGDHILRIVGVNLGGPAGVAFIITHDDAPLTTPAKHLLSGAPVGDKIEVGGKSEVVLANLLGGIFGGAACCCCGGCIVCAYLQRASERKRKQERERERERESVRERARERESERDRKRESARARKRE